MHVASAPPLRRKLLAAISHQRRPVVLQRLRFAIVGASNTLLSFGLYTLFLGLGVHYLLAPCIAWVVATANSYVLNRRWTFRSSSRRGPEALRFVTIQIGGLALNLGLLYLLVQIGQVSLLGAQALAIPAVSVVTFLANRRWTFALEPQPVDRRVDRRRNQLALAGSLLLALALRAPYASVQWQGVNDWGLDPAGRTARLIEQHYTRVTTVADHPIYHRSAA